MDWSMWVYSGGAVALPAPTPASGAAPAGTGTGTGTGSASDGGSRASGASSSGSEASRGGGETGDDRGSAVGADCSGDGGETSSSGGQISDGGGGGGSDPARPASAAAAAEMAVCSGAAAAGSSSAHVRRHEDNSTWGRRVQSSSFMDAALLHGRRVEASGAMGPAHGKCTNEYLGNKCHHSLWGGPDEQASNYGAHLKRLSNMGFMGRSALVYETLSHSAIQEQHADGSYTGDVLLVYRAPNGRAVCRHTFLLIYPIGKSSLYSIESKVVRGESLHGNSDKASSVSDDSKWLTVIGWYQGYSDAVGDWVPHKGKHVVPRRELTDLYDEFVHAAGSSVACQYSWFCKCIGSASEIEHIQMQQPTLNFQDCKQCVDDNTKVTSALKSKDAAKIVAAKAERAEHHREHRGERLCYQKRIGLSQQGLTSCVSLILDKWDSSTTTCPFFPRAPGGFWSSCQQEVLQLHVLGVLAHLPGGKRPFVYVFNDSIKGDANANIEGIRRTLVHLYSGDAKMPEVLYVQADNASDNKNWTLLAFFGMLVHHGYVREVQFSFLLVGHTHEDIDQLFSVLSKHFKSRHPQGLLTPQTFLSAVKEALQKHREPVVEEMQHVRDWIRFLRPHLVSPLPTGMQHATMPWDMNGDGSNSASATVTKSPHTFKISKRADGKVVLHYKELSADAIWLPGLPTDAPTYTNPEGILLFSAIDGPPRDPLASGVEVPFVELLSARAVEIAAAAAAGRQGPGGEGRR